MTKTIGAAALCWFLLGTPLSAVARIPAAGAKPDALAYDPATRRIFVGLAGSSAFSVIDAPTSTKTVAVDPKSHHVHLPTAQYGTASAATAENPKPKAPVLPGTFTVLDVHPVR